MYVGCVGAQHGRTGVVKDSAWGRIAGGGGEESGMVYLSAFACGSGALLAF